MQTRRVNNEVDSLQCDRLPIFKEKLSTTCNWAAWTEMQFCSPVLLSSQTSVPPKFVVSRKRTTIRVFTSVLWFMMCRSKDYGNPLFVLTFHFVRGALCPLRNLSSSGTGNRFTIPWAIFLASDHVQKYYSVPTVRLTLSENMRRLQ